MLLRAQDPTPSAPPAPTTPATPVATLHGTVVAGTPGKPGAVPLPGVTVTATSTLTGRKVATTTDIDGNFALAIPRFGRYVLKTDFAAFAPSSQEVVVNAETAATLAPAQFGLELASRAAAEAAQQQTQAASLTRGLQSLSLGNTVSSDTTDATASAGNSGATLSGLADSSAASSDTVAVSGATGTTNPLGNISEDEIRSRIEDAIQQARNSGALPQGADTNNLVANLLGGVIGAGGFGGPGGGGPGVFILGGGGPGGGGGGRGGFGNFRNFNPAQPHGAVFWQGSNNALNSAPWSPTLQPLIEPAGYSNRFGVTLGMSPYLPGLTKPNNKQFVFVNLTGQKNLNAFLPNPVRVPTAQERGGDFSQSGVTLYDPHTGAPIPGNNLANATVPIAPQALALLNYYPAPNIPVNAQGYNYQTVSNAGNNNVAINSRYVRNFGQQAGAGPFGFGGSGGGSGRSSGSRGSSGNRQSSKTPPALRQNINLSYNYSHSAADQRNIFLPLGGANQNDGNALSIGYTIGYGRLSNNATLSWNRNNARTRNYFTDTSSNPSQTAGLTIPNNASGFADPRFYNGLPTLSIANEATLSNTTPSSTINQTIAFSDFISWRHKKHNLRFGGDYRRVHADSIGGNNPLGSFTFTGYATESPSDQSGATQTGSGYAFADFLLGLPQSTAIQAGLYKTYLRENVYDFYANDDFRLSGAITLNFGLRYDSFAPYTELHNRLVNLDHNADFTAFSTIFPNGTGTYQGAYNTSLINPDHALISPRFGLAWRLKNKGFTKNTVLRTGYGINYNTSQFATFARSLSHQVPFSATQTNTLSTGCTTTTTTTTANFTLANGFGCSTNVTTQSNYAVDKNYRLGMVQVWNLNLQRTVKNIVLNVGYNGSYGTNLDVLGSPNSSPTGNLTPQYALFQYDRSIGTSRSNQLVISAQKRQTHGIALGATYTYGHAISNATGVSGNSGSPIQNFFRPDLEYANANFDQRHNLSGNWVAELPFGPNRAFLNKGGTWSHVLDGFSLSGNFTFATGSYLTPQYQASVSEARSGSLYTQRPNRDSTQSIKGPGSLRQWFNTAAFSAPAIGQYGNAAPNSILGPGTVSTSAALSRTVNLGDTRSIEVRMTANNVFNTVQYSGVNTTLPSSVNAHFINTFGEVTSAASMRSLNFLARFRF